MTTFDDARLLAAMRAYVRAADAVTEAVAAGDDRSVIDRAEQRSIAALSLRRRLTELGWSAPPRVARQSPAPGGCAGEAPGEA